MFRDRRLRLALELSLLLHLLLAWLLPAGHRAVLALVPPPPLANPADAAQEPIRFELVELPVERQEAPAQPKAPASDLSRRAHGGEGEPADRPGVVGTTPDLRVAPPLPGHAGQSQPAGQVQPAPTPAPEPATPDRGASTLVAPPTPAPVPPLKLRGLSPLEGGAGTGGALPHRRGGQVDLGPLSFDTQWYDWGPYAAEMLRRIRYHWNVPEIARLGAAGVTRIHFVIERNGRVSSIEIQRESGHPSMDFAARDAIANASPLPPLPPDLFGVEREGVTITFFYNTEPPKDVGR
ncbi:MAG: TonB family protein [Thermoanaerobaculaceae bacterium]|nr:TonB family protein [Thermoanaerobaculaceae bacterium]